MIPDNVVGLLLFVASLAPGYVYTIISERYEPRGDRSALMEAAGLVLVGALSSVVALLVLLIIAQATGFLDLGRILEHGTDYLANEPIKVLVSLVAALLLALVFAVVAALWVHRKQEPSLRPNRPVWLEVERKAREGGNPAFVAIQLRDGRVLEGFADAYSVVTAGDERRDFALQAPIYLRASVDAKRVKWGNTASVAVPDSEIVFLAFSRFSLPQM